MIRLSRLNGQPIAINCDLIEWVEATPDTTVRMISGHSILVLEHVEAVIERILAYRRQLLETLGPDALLATVPPGGALLAAGEGGRDVARGWELRRDLRGEQS